MNWMATLGALSLACWIIWEVHRVSYDRGHAKGFSACVDRMLEAPPGLYGGTGIAGEDIRCGDRTETNPDTGHLQRSRPRVPVSVTPEQADTCHICGGSMAERTHDPDCPYHPVYNTLYHRKN